MGRPAAAKWLRVTHIGASVGWLATVAAFLVLASAGLSAGETTAAGIYEATAVLTWVLIVPLCGLTLASGVAISLQTPWGLLNHYWVVFKLGIAVAATIGLVIHLAPITDAADAADPQMAARVQLVVASALALALLAAALVLSTFRPRGLTKRGARRQQREQSVLDRADVA